MMKGMEYLAQGELVAHSLEEVMQIVSVLAKNGYVTMISKEEGLWIVNYIWTQHCDRNDVVFQEREVIEEIFFEKI